MDWIDYWNNENITSEEIIKKNNIFFFKNTLEILQYKSDDIILDIGSGKGFFDQLLIDKVKEIHLCETSIKCIETCKKRFEGHKNIFYHHLPNNDYLNFNFMNTKPTKIFVISVIQYYKSLAEVKTLIEECQKLSIKNKTQLIIGDIPISNNIFKDTISILHSSFQQKTLKDTLIFLIKSFFGNYRKLRKKNKIITYEIDELKSMLKEMYINYNIIKEISYIKNRISLFIHF